MAGYDNVRKYTFTKEDAERARKAGKKGGAAAGKIQHERKKLREILEQMLRIERNGITTGQAITMALIEKALSGDTKAYEVVRDTIGEKPANVVNKTVDAKLEVSWQQ